MLSYVMPNMQFMQISVAVHYSAYFGLGILYCIYKGRIDAILLRYKYGMFWDRLLYPLAYCHGNWLPH